MNRDGEPPMTATPLTRPSTPPPREAALVARTRAGDQEAAALLVEAQAERVAAIVSAILGPGAPDVDDAVQETLIRALERLHQCRSDEGFPAWLTRIAQNVCRDLRKSAWRSRVTLSDGPEPQPSVHDHADGLALRRALSVLPDERRMVLVLRFVYGYTLGEIGALLGTDAEAARSRVRRALAHARKLLGPGWEEDLP
jgi:RNA polymerase sigma factor (sigma-70 family)